MQAERARRILAGLGIAVGVASCSHVGQLSPQAQRAVDTVTCYVAVITPYVGDALDVGELVRESLQGRADLPRALALLGASAEDIELVTMAMAACRGLPDLAPMPPELAGR